MKFAASVEISPEVNSRSLWTQQHTLVSESSAECKAFGHSRLLLSSLRPSRVASVKGAAQIGQFEFSRRACEMSTALFSSPYLFLDFFDQSHGNHFGRRELLRPRKWSACPSFASSSSRDNNCCCPYILKDQPSEKAARLLFCFRSLISSDAARSGLCVFSPSPSASLLTEAIT